MAKRIENGEARPTHEEIAQRAHEIYEASGRLPGRDLDNWLRAETELQGARKAPADHRTENRDLATPSRPASTARTTREAASRTSS